MEHLFIDQIPILAQVNVVSVAVRLGLAILLGGVLGFERESKRRPAGLRTYVVVCIGSTIAMLTNQYIYQFFGTGDPTRIGAQVISGIGFLGAGTIIVTGHNQVKGLTTAAGLWGSAALGLAIGVGFYTGAILGCMSIFVAMKALHSIDTYLLRNTRYMLVYVEFKELKYVSQFLSFVRANDMSSSGLEMNRTKGQTDSTVSIVTNIRLDYKVAHEIVLETLGTLEGITYIEEM